ncbi:MAG: ribosome assembly RNA-binding protein YhbY [Candidatus Marinimicrobia bacterium]|nr:ribosome assembly RNA-binding protein YhbY [Candidatus Neomarinimicrobiota bacterium]
MQKLLSSKQKKYLKSKAHPLKAIIQIGKSGLTEESVLSIAHALEHHELLKIKFLAFKEEKDQYIEPIIQRTGAQFVSLIGHILTIYREHEEQEKRQYQLPA